MTLLFFADFFFLFIFCVRTNMKYMKITMATRGNKTSNKKVFYHCFGGDILTETLNTELVGTFLIVIVLVNLSVPTSHYNEYKN